MTRPARRAAGLVAGLAGLTGLVGVVALGGCAAPPGDPVGVAAVGLDGSGYLGVVRLCDEGSTYTRVALAGPGESVDDAAISWIGRSVEPVTFFHLAGDPPDNFVVDSDGPVADDVAYTFRLHGEDLDITGPTVTAAELRALTPGDVIQADGRARPVDDFLADACE